MSDDERPSRGRVASDVLRRIRRDHVEKALDALDAGIAHEFGPSTGYDLVERGRKYPPKAAVGVAARFAIGEQLGPHDFSGGEESVCFEVLRRCGYQVVPKDAAEPGLALTHVWIFQGNPDAFDIDAYLGRALPRISWSVNQSRDRIQVGDRVYLWRAAGQRAKTDAGIVAECTVLSTPWQGEDDPASLDLWRGAPGPPDAWHVWLRVEKRASAKQVVKRAWLKEDPICRNLPIIKQPAGTNYPVPADCLERLRRLWERTGEDWSRAESVAGLWAYDVTYRREVSRSGDSPVVEVALRTGRAVSGVYNKLMNFRALDPRDDREGLPAGSAVDREAWQEFYDESREVLRTDALRAAYFDLWGEEASAPGASSVESVAEEPPPATPSPTRASQTTFRVLRDSAVTRWVKAQHEYRCQACGTRLDSPKGPVAEGAHIRPLGAIHEGPDDVRNVLCLCPNHHALFDRGAFVVADDLRLLSTQVGGLLEKLATRPTHVVALEYLQYHRTAVARWSDAVGEREPPR